jgi:hypothetical protein
MFNCARNGMTVLVSVKINERGVMAEDSASSYASGMI